MSRIASLLVAIPFLAYLMSHMGQKGILFGIYSIALPMACIWFSDTMGGMTGMMGRLNGPGITKETPGCIVHVAGWLLLVIVIATKVYLQRT